MLIYGSVARGDHHDESDIDIMAITKGKGIPEGELEQLGQECQKLFKERVSGFGYADLCQKTEDEMSEGIRFLNSFESTAWEEGIRTIPRNENEHRERGTEYREEQEKTVDWRDVDFKMADAKSMPIIVEILIDGLRERGLEDNSSQQMALGVIIQKGLENSYKAFIGATGREYPTTSRDGHNLEGLASIIKETEGWPEDVDVPGEHLSFFTAFSGSFTYSQDRERYETNLLKEKTAEAIEEIGKLVDALRPEPEEPP